MAGLFSVVPSGLLGGQCPPYIWSVAVPTMNGGAIFIRPFGTSWWAMPTLHLVRSATGGSALAGQLPGVPRRFETEFLIYRAKSTAAERSGFQRKIVSGGNDAGWATRPGISAVPTGLKAHSDSATQRSIAGLFSNVPPGQTSVGRSFARIFHRGARRGRRDVTGKNLAKPTQNDG